MLFSSTGLGFEEKMQHIPYKEEHPVWNRYQPPLCSLDLVKHAEKYISLESLKLNVK